MKFVSPTVSAVTPNHVSAKVGIVLPTPKTKTSLWLLFVPMDGQPDVKEHEDTEAVQKALTALVDAKRTGWVYLMEGKRYPVTFGQTRVMHLQGQEHRLDSPDSGKVDVLPGTKLYPV